jgi:hypothetical protein
MMGCLAVAIGAMLIWSNQRPGSPAGNPPPQPIAESIIDGGIVLASVVEPATSSSFPKEVDPPSNPIVLVPPMPAPAPVTQPAVDPAPKEECADMPVALPPATNEPPLIRTVVDVSVPMPTASAPVPFPWRLSMEIVGSLTQFELRRGDESLVRVQCEALEFSTAGGGLVARGKVLVSGPCHEARCDRMTVAWQSGEVALDGGVQLSFRHEGVVQQMRADALTFRLDGAHQPVEFTTRDVQIKVIPKP